MKIAKAEFGKSEILERRASIYLCHKFGGLKLLEIGEYFKVRDTGVSEASRRFAKELEKDEKRREIVERIKVGLKKCGM